MQFNNSEYAGFEEFLNILLSNLFTTNSISADDIKGLLGIIYYNSLQTPKEDPMIEHLILTILANINADTVITDTVSSNPVYSTANAGIKILEDKYISKHFTDEFVAELDDVSNAFALLLSSRLKEKV